MDRAENGKRGANARGSVCLFIVSMLIFGTVGVLRRSIALPSALLAFARGILGGMFLLAFIAWKKRDRGEAPPPGALPRLVLTGAMIGVNWILLFEAYTHTTVAVATLCYYMAPTVVMLLSPVFFKERLTAKKAVCAAAAFAGMALVSGVFGGGADGASPAGVLFGLGAALFYAAVVILNKKTPGLDPYRRTAVLLLSAGAVMLPYLLLTKGFSFGGVGLKDVLLLFVLGVVHTGAAYTMYFGSMEGLRVQTIAVLSYIDPVSALLFSALLLKEPLGVWNLLGAVMIIGSALVSELRPPKRPA